MQINYFLIILGAFLLSAVLVNLIKKLSLKFNLLIVKGVPASGGLGFSISFFLVSSAAFYFSHAFSKEVTGVMLSSMVMLIFGIIDDWRELSVLTKFTAQLIAVSILIGFGVRTQIVYIGGFLNIIVTAIWVLGITNSINHLDVMDGIAAGVAIIVSLTFFVISFLNNDVKSAILSLALAGVVLGFLPRNLPPARIYMGNTGSHFLGFLLSAIALLISYAPLQNKIALLSPILILGFPILDSLFLIFLRIKKGRLIFRKSEDHLALRFLKLGYSKNKTLIFMLLWCFLLCLSGLAVDMLSNPLGIASIITVVFTILFMCKKSGRALVNG